jgi:amino acid transporter
MCIPRNDPALLQANKEADGTAAQSPFVIVIKNSGIKVLDHIVNAVVLTSAFSSGNEFLYASSRALFMLAQQGQAPRIFAKILPNGVPIYALAVTALFSLLGFLACGGKGANTAFNWLANITTLGSMLTWLGVAISHIRFSRGMAAQGIPRSSLPFHSFLMPWGSYVILVSFIIIILYVVSSSLRHRLISFPSLASLDGRQSSHSLPLTSFQRTSTSFSSSSCMVAGRSRRRLNLSLSPRWIGMCHVL